MELLCYIQHAFQDVPEREYDLVLPLLMVPDESHANTLLVNHSLDGLDDSNFVVQDDHLLVVRHHVTYAVFLHE